MKIFRAGQAGRPQALIAPPWSVGALGGFTFLVCYLRSFHFPNVPFLLWGDALGYATKSIRILEGEWPYRDFFDFVTPGTELVYAILFHWIGVALWVPNLLMCLLATLTTLWVTWCARRLVYGDFVLVPGLLVTGFVLAGSFDATHHWFSTLFVMAAVAVLFGGLSSGRILVAGTLCGLAASFTQSKGVAVLLAFLIYLWWKSQQEPVEGKLFKRRALQLCVATLVAFAIVNLPFVAAAGLHRWSADLIVFPLRYFSTVSLNNWHVMALEFGQKNGLLKWVCLPFLYLVVPVAYSWTFLEVWKRRKAEREEHWNQLMLLALTGGAMLIAVAPALSMRRISCASPPAMILLVWLLSRKGRSWQVAARSLAAISVALAVALVAAAQLHQADQLDLPAGRVAIADPRNAEVYRWMARQTHPGQWYFGMPPYTLPLALKNPTPIEAPGPGEYSRPEQIAAVVEGLERTQTKLLLLRPAMYIPHLLEYKKDHLQPFHDYLFGHYRRTRLFATGDEVWERIPLP